MAGCDHYRCDFLSECRLENAPQAIMQTRCIFCKKEQYAPRVYEVSLALVGCVWCGRVPPIFDDVNRYLDALHREREDD